jgi:DNA polymerase III sliding clamp (beta) subunit (PCNA family)
VTSRFGLWFRNVLNDKEIIRNSSLGATLVNAHVITEVVRKLEGTEVSMEIIDNVIAKIDDGKATFKLNCISAEEYPHIDFEKAAIRLCSLAPTSRPS